MRKPASADSDRETFPDIEAQIGEDPAQWLDRDLVEKGASHTDSSPQRLVMARIRGIDDIGVANGWIKVRSSILWLGIGWIAQG